ncbi:MAG: LacI family transcriptional regulator [Clostridiales bacterium]|nr:LacI family transcriptional regulator [Clostridiales bacterium]
MNIHDIAALSGVSAATVSRVINNSQNVSPEKREAVLRAMSEADYIPNAFAGGIGRNAMRIVGILVTDVANLYYATAVSLLEKELRELGFDVLLCCTGTRLQDKKEALKGLLRKRVDAVFLVGSAYREERDNTHIRETAASVPVFLINAYVAISNVFCVYCDEREAMRLGVRHLYGAGCRGILYIHDMTKWAWAGSQKLAGYKDGLAECGLTEDPCLIQVVGSGIAPTYQRVKELIEDGAVFSGILTSEDILAVGAMKAVTEKKPGVPVLGFNNSQFALCCTPELPSIDNMLETICPMVVSMLSRLFAGEKIPSKVVVSAVLAERREKI